ncbi:hypothetical protein [Neptunomonas qingdaonensis]|uniref:Uncharacterized protein n=1 Tax=Neptunomonas qingdaonensis TaxID=1045558 RepID=A0A1I2RFT5_9GAMM|nr:hypothetical protein [Neptunomonas qingdaonensis]SFG37477.1 hypothetical protein SAMN05216175_10623 [Neptunomonas qingdaonensis]
MRIIDEILKQVKEHKHSRSSEVLAGAVLSACGLPCKAFTLLSVSTRLDAQGKTLVAELMNIAQQPDFSNADQDAAIVKIKELMPHLLE